MNAADLDGPFFLDTNVLVYSFDHDAPARRLASVQLLHLGLSTGFGTVSTQVAQEFLHLALTRFKRPFTVPEAKAYFSLTIAPMCRVQTTPELLESALSIRAETGYAFYDSLIVAAAVQAQCPWLLTEYLQAGREVRGVTIVNPYVKS